MIDLKVCPSTLEEGYNSYSPSARKALFDGRMVEPFLTVPSPSVDSVEAKEVFRNVGRISLSGVQPKFSIVIGEDLRFRYAQEGERGTYILKK